jgi:WD40 repeat protein
MKRITLLLIWLMTAHAAALELNGLKNLQTLRLENTGGRLTDVQFSPDEQHVLSVDQRYTVSLWDIAKGERLWKYNFAPTPYAEVGVIRASFANADTVRLELSNDQSLTLDAFNGQPRATSMTIPSLRTRVSQCSRVATDQLNAIDESALLCAYTLNNGTEIALNDLKTSAMVARLSEYHGQVVQLRFNPDGTLLAAFRNDGRVSIWDVQRRVKRFNLRAHAPDSIYDDSGLVWSADGKRLLSQDWRSQIVWDTATGVQLSRSNLADLHPAIYVADLSKSGTRVALGTSSGSIEIMNAADGSRLTTVGFPVSKTLFSQDASQLYVVALDGRVRAYKRDLKGTYALNNELRFSNAANNAALLESRAELVAVTNTGLEVLSLQTGERRAFEVRRNGGTSITAVPNSSLVILNTETLFDVEKGMLDGASTGFNCWVGPLRFDLGLRLCVGTTLRLIRLNDDQTLWQRPWSTSSAALGWSTSGSLLALSWLQDRIAVLEAKTGKTRLLLNATYSGKPDEKPSFEQIMFSPNERVLFAQFSDRTLRYFHLETRKKLSTPPALQTALEAQFTPDGRALALTTLEGIALWGVPGQRVFGR